MTMASMTILFESAGTPFSCMSLIVIAIDVVHLSRVWSPISRTDALDPVTNLVSCESIYPYEDTSIMMLETAPSLRVSTIAIDWLDSL